MDLFTQITNAYPDLTILNFGDGGLIRLQDDGDGIQYIAKWDYDQPIPNGFKLGK